MLYDPARRYMKLQIKIGFDNIYIRLGTKLYRQNVGIPMGTNCAPLVADLFLYCHYIAYVEIGMKWYRIDDMTMIFVFLKK